MELFASHQYQELRPSLVRRARPSRVSSDQLGKIQVKRDVLCLDTDGELTALRSDFTLSLAELFVARFDTPPRRVCYAGPIFRAPVGAWDVTERFEVGCEYTHLTAEGTDADSELYTMMAAAIVAIGLTEGTLQLAHAALARRPLDLEGVHGAQRELFVNALSLRALHRVEPALEGLPAKSRLTQHARALLADDLALSPYRDELAADADALDAAAAALGARLPDKIAVKCDYASVDGLDFYTGPVARLWAPHASGELLAGGRYDALYPSLGRPWSAAGFCVRLSRLLTLQQTHPALFEDSP